MKYILHNRLSQVEVHAIKALKYLSLVRNLVCPSILHHSNVIHIQIQFVVLFVRLNKLKFVDEHIF